MTFPRVTMSEVWQQPGTGARVVLTLGPMNVGPRFYACRWLNGHPQQVWNGWNALTVAGVLTRWRAFEQRIGSRQISS